MRHNPLRHVPVAVSRRSKAGCLACAISLKNPSCRPHIPADRQNFEPHCWYFLTGRRLSVSLLPIVEKRAGSNLHRRVVVCRFVPTRR